VSLAGTQEGFSMVKAVGIGVTIVGLQATVGELRGGIFCY
jgi:hypothetical protein